jgi:hypothetical protein
MLNWKTRECVQEVLALTFAVLFLMFAIAAPAAAQDSATKAQCERDATTCLHRCASIDQRIKGNAEKYNQCVPDCDRTRTSCLLFSSRK